MSALCRSHQRAPVSVSSASNGPRSSCTGATVGDLGGAWTFVRKTSETRTESLTVPTWEGNRASVPSAHDHTPEATEGQGSAQADRGHPGGEDDRGGHPAGP